MSTPKPVPKRPLRIASAAMTALFVFAAAVQWNDPDPLLWIALYLGAAVLAGLAAAGRRPPVANALAAALFLGFALAWSPSLWSARSEAFTSIHMQEPRDEEPRETVGLLLCAAWTAGLALSELRARHKARAGSAR